MNSIMRSMAILLFMVSPGLALEPAEIAIVVNRAVPSSTELAEYYCQVRGVPRENIVSLVLTRNEDITREEYDKWLVKPLREKLEGRKDKIKCLLVMYGVPLRVGPKTPSDDEKAEVERLQPALAAAKEKAASADASTAAKGKAELAKIETELIILKQTESTASVDSELMLLWWDNYPLARWIMNPLHWQVNEAARRAKPPVMMTTRLDGPSFAIVKRLIDDAVAVEEKGLTGNVYVDARGIPFDPKKPSENGGYGYGGYDESMREMAALFKNTKLPVTLDNEEKLFAPKSCPNAALYCGWYSHGKYVDCCTFTRGAVAWHLASSEAVTLRKDDSTLWCPNLLKAGVAATLGPVAEPYSIGFPKPEEFFGFLATGNFTLAEVHARTQHFASWMTVCVGDPLYTPFKKNKLLLNSDVHPSPKAGRSLFR
jgi:uncharacterized protein (TIGR03790 family)